MSDELPTQAEIKALVGLAQTVYLEYNYRCKPHKNSGALERHRCSFSTYDRGVDTMLDHTLVPYFPPNLQDYAPWVATHGLLAPYGECQCGCGETVPTSSENRRSNGLCAGHPKRFVSSHNSRRHFHHPVESFADGKTCHIKLSMGKVAIVDAADFEWLSQWKWHLCNSYAARLDMTTSKLVYMHRQILDIPRDSKTDHINGDKLDNRRENLRECNVAQNNANKPSKGGTSRFKGVSWQSDAKKWVVRIQINGKNIHLGCYQDEEDAARTYDNAATKYHGEFARLNFPETTE